MKNIEVLKKYLSSGEYDELISILTYLKLSGTNYSIHSDKMCYQLFIDDSINVEFSKNKILILHMKKSFLNGNISYVNKDCPQDKTKSIAILKRLVVKIFK
ncbi:hypothetical protein D3C81_1426510 [compost metagenome]